MIDDSINKQPAANEDKPFKTPDEVAENDTGQPEPQLSTESAGPPSALPSNEKKSKPKLKERWQALSKKRKAMVIIIIAVVVLAIAGGITFALTRHHPAEPKKATVKIMPAPKPLVSNLTGLPISSASINQRPVTGVMVENSLDARPQSGLNQAGVVFEAIAEAGITRFLMLYQDSQPDYIGPVRSARPYFVQWDLGFDAPYAHVGGSPEALTDIQSWGVRDMNQSYNSGAFERISSRASPHNVYTSAAQLNALEASKGYTSSQFTSFPRKADSPSKTPNAASIDINPSSSDYNDHYDYDAGTNSYKRSEGGAPHMEINKDGTQTQITPKVVIAMVMQYSLEADGYHSQYNVIGSGQAYVFQDGTVTPGTWAKATNAGPITFTSTSGQAIKLNAGQTWITAVGSASDVTYK